MFLQSRLARHPAAPPAPRPGLVHRPSRACIPPSFPYSVLTPAKLSMSRDPDLLRFGGAIDRLPAGRQSCSAPPTRDAVSLSHSPNTLAWCCTSFVNSGNPVQDGNCHQIPACAGMTIIFWIQCKLITRYAAARLATTFPNSAMILSMSSKLWPADTEQRNRHNLLGVPGGRAMFT